LSRTREKALNDAITSADPSAGFEPFAYIEFYHSDAQVKIENRELQGQFPNAVSAKQICGFWTNRRLLFPYRLWKGCPSSSRNQRQANGAPNFRKRNLWALGKHLISLSSALYDQLESS
jgi:hypothetical protein